MKTKRPAFVYDETRAAELVARATQRLLALEPADIFQIARYCFTGVSYVPLQEKRK